MANEKNLIPLNKRTQRERKEIARKGAEASNRVQAERKTLKECADYLLALPVSDMRKHNKLARMGVPVEGIDNKMLLVAAMMVEGQLGNVAAFKELRDLIGEAGNQTDENALAKAREILGGVDSGI